MKRNTYHVPIYEIERILSDEKIVGINFIHEINDELVSTLTILPEGPNGFINLNNSFKIEEMKNESELRSVSN